MKNLISMAMLLIALPRASGCMETLDSEEERDQSDVAAENNSGAASAEVTDEDLAAMENGPPLAMFDLDDPDGWVNDGSEDMTSNDAVPDAVAQSTSPAAALACNGTSSPFATGPRCCPRPTVLRPWQRVCQRFYDLSPRRDSYGSYNGSTDQPNTLIVTTDTLQICAMYVADNGEGDSRPHGPYGNLYVDFFDSSEPLSASPDGAASRRLGPARQLRGPHRTHDTTDEWLDDEFQRYQRFGVFRWSGRSSLVVRVWESDGSEDGSWGRRNDVLGMERIARSATLGSTWIPLHKYTNDHPRRRTSTVTGWLYLKTGGTCPR